MKKIGFVFSSAPHGSASGREGLDAVLAASNYTDDIALFFVGDGVFQLLRDQDPEKILSRNYIATFKMLPLCDVTQVYVCADSLLTRGLTTSDLVIHLEEKDPKALGQLMTACCNLLRF